MTVTTRLKIADGQQPDSKRTTDEPITLKLTMKLGLRLPSGVAKLASAIGRFTTDSKAAGPPATH